MEASLIGKALVFGSKECRFEPCVSNMRYNVNSYVANHFNILNSKKSPRITIKYTTKSINVIRLLYSSRIIQSYLITKDNRSFKYITFCSYHYKNTPFFSHFKIISTPSKCQLISLSALKVISKSIGNSVLILETDKGIINHTSALSHKIGGKLLGIVS